jgi:hypothetical protein
MPFSLTQFFKVHRARFASVAAALSLWLSSIGTVTAEGGTDRCPEGQLCNPIKYPDITTFLLAILDVAIQYGALLIVFFIVFAGFKFVTAQGNTEKISDARKMLTWIVVGAFVLLGVYVIRAAICGTINQLAGDDDYLKCSEQFESR